MTLFILGIVGLLASWAIAWNHNLPFSEHSFFPLWLGYISTVNGLSQVLFGHSLLTTLKKRFVILFLISVPFWWTFEGANLFVSNWQYILPHTVSKLEYFFRASISFSTVVPAVLSTTYFLNSFLKDTRLNTQKKLNLSYRFWLLALGLGIFSLFLIYKFPTIAFPLVWLSLVLITEPLNFFFGFNSWLKKISEGNWTPFVSIVAGTLACGFFWELWNYYSLPKWIYTLPHFYYFKVFEMPVLGYLGYLPFGLEVYSFSQFIWGMLFGKISTSASKGSAL